MSDKNIIRLNAETRSIYKLMHDNDIIFCRKSFI